MNIAILSRGAALYSTQSLFRAARMRGHYVRVIDHKRCNLVIERGLPRVYYEGAPLVGVDAVIPRIGASFTDYGAAVIRQFEMMGVHTSISSEALIVARDKLKCLQALTAAGIAVPKTFVAGSVEDVPFLLDRLTELPVVIKLLESTHGTGVILAHSRTTAISVVEAFVKMNKQVLLQEYIKESNGADIRAFVVGRRIVASMKRQAPQGEFRSNLHRGGTATTVQLTPLEKEIVLKTTDLLQLSIAGVDLLRSNHGPLVMEVNASPGLEGIEATTGVDIAGAIIENTVSNIRRHYRMSSRPQ
ncbi:MAG TPA: RimK family alpha-L-glutamate ligase [Bacteroidetes bacterium]|nr:RimK family alpha-L-glutamate ligase [Bacteroidota bacterium]